jgi:DNA-binding protein H-NS
MTQIDLSSLTPDQLQELADKAKDLAKDKRSASVSDACKRINEIADQAGLAVRIFESKAGRRTLPVKYRDPNTPNNVWKAMGKKPAWLQKYLDEGRNIEEFAV